MINLLGLIAMTGLVPVWLRVMGAIALFVLLIAMLQIAFQAWVFWAAAQANKKGR